MQVCQLYQYNEVYFKEIECFSSIADAILKIHNTALFWSEISALYKSECLKRI